MADSKEEIDEIFRFLAETALHERPCGENHTLSSFFLKLLEHNAPPKGFTKVVDLSDASYGDQIIKPYLEPLMKETKDSCPENVLAFLKTAIRRRSLSSNRKTKKVLQNASAYVISNVGRVKKETSPTTRSSNDITNDSGDQLDGLIVETAKKSGGGMKLSLDLSAASMKGGKKPKMAHPMSCPPMYLLKQRKILEKLCGN